MNPLQIKAKCIADADTRRAHIEHAQGLGYPEFGPSPAHNGDIVVVGSGPSVRRQLKKIRALKRKGYYVLAVKGAHEFLLKEGIVPNAALAVDPQAYIKKNFVSHREGITYFIASQCHPEVFELLEGREVVVFHLLMKSNRDLMRGRFELPGGSTSGLRAMVLGWFAGFRKFHLFGFDSCLQGNLRKITGDTYEERVLDLWCEGKKFRADPAMASQANEFEAICRMMPGSKFKVYGEGLIQHVVKALIKKGEPGFYAVNHDFSDHCIPDLRRAVPEAVARKREEAANGFLRGTGFV